MERFDVVIIGGGLVGCAAAFYLSRRGASVLLLERGDLNAEASGANAGSLHFQLEYRLIRHGEKQAAEFAQIIPLSLVAISDWRALESELDADLEVGMGGGLILAESEADLRILEQRQALQDRWNLSSRLLTAAEVRRMAPYLSEAVLGAGYSADEGHANPRLVTPAFARAAAARGARLSARTRVVALERSGREWHVRARTHGGEARDVIGRSVLNAAGAWAGEIAAMAHLHLPIFAVPLSMNVLERSRPMIPHLVQHTSERLTVKQVSAGNVLVGGGWPGRFRALDSNLQSNIDTRARPEPVLRNLIANLAVAARLIPALRDRHLLRSWTGTTGVTSDQMPLLGEVPEAPGFFVAAGGAAFTHGPTYARLISESIADGEPSQPIDLYHPSRFSHVNSFMASA